VCMWDWKRISCSGYYRFLLTKGTGCQLSLIGIETRPQALSTAIDHHDSG
jgi:hypothetical protein